MTREVRAARDPRPAIPAGVLLGRSVVLWLCVAAAVGLSMIAAFADRTLLTLVDEPVERFVLDRRTPFLDDVFLAVTDLGDGAVVAALMAICAVMTLRSSPRAALAIVLGLGARFALDHPLKELIDRPRPSTAPLVDVTSPAYPSGHALGATIAWGLLPAALLAVTKSRLVWRVSAAVWAIVVVGVCVSRVYLGVHWTSDVVGGALIGLVVLVAVDRVQPRNQARRGVVPRPVAGREPLS